jgi:hypothetical protein
VTVGRNPGKHARAKPIVPDKRERGGYRGYYVFANSVGPQGGGKWSAGDSKIVAPDGRVLRLADNENEALLVADLDLALATRKYALDSLEHPRFLAPRWRGMVAQVVRQSKIEGRLTLPGQGPKRRADSRDP